MIKKKWLDLIVFVYKGRNMSFVACPTSRYVTLWDMKHATVTWIATWLRAWAVLFSLPGSVMGRETVYLCYDFSEVLQSWWDRYANESRKKYHWTDKLGPRRRIQDVSLQISVTNCVPLSGYTITVITMLYAILCYVLTNNNIIWL